MKGGIDKSLAEFEQILASLAEAEEDLYGKNPDYQKYVDEYEKAIKLKNPKKIEAAKNILDSEKRKIEDFYKYKLIQLNESNYEMDDQYYEDLENLNNKKMAARNLLERYIEFKKKNKTKKQNDSQ